MPQKMTFLSEKEADFGRSFCGMQNKGGSQTISIPGRRLAESPVGSEAGKANRRGSSWREKFST